MPDLVRTGNSEGVELTGLGSHQPRTDGVEFKHDLIALDRLLPKHGAGHEVLPVGLTQCNIGVAQAYRLLVLGMEGNGVTGVD